MCLAFMLIYVPRSTIKGKYIRWYSKRFGQINNCYFLINCQLRTSCRWTNKTSHSSFCCVVFNFINSRQINYSCTLNALHIKYLELLLISLCCVNGVSLMNFTHFPSPNTHWICASFGIAIECCTESIKH